MSNFLGKSRFLYTHRNIIGHKLLIGRFVICKMCTPMCASARVASSNIMISEDRSHRELGY